MNKTAIKNFAVWARNKLIAEITYKAGLLGITENGIAKELPNSEPNLKLYDIGTKEPVKIQGNAILQRKALADKISVKASEVQYKKAFEYVIEEVAYTWFNRLIAIRYMEVKDFLPVRVLSSESKGKKEPDMVTTPFETEIEFSDADRETMLNLKDDELFRFLFIKQCNQLHEYLPELFEQTDNYTELLLPISFTDEDGIVYHLVNDISEEDFGEQVQIIGWLYQYYNTEPKDKVFSRKSTEKIQKEDIPAATQLFTPDWIVRYMVENSLGRLWVDGHEDYDKSEWKYYLAEAHQEESVKAQLDEIRKECRNLSPEDIKFLDPCMGSGHILVYAFDVFMQIYLSQGYTERDAASKIIENNLFGLDIDKRAYQLSYFALMMKAREADRRFLKREIKPNLANFAELNAVNPDALNGKLKDFAEQFKNADTYGSLMEVSGFDANEIAGLIANLEENIFTQGYTETLEKMLNAYKILSQKYDVVTTNPPYMGGSGMDAKLSDFVKKNYPDYKSDLFSVFMIKCMEFAKPNGFLGFLTPYVWMFIQSYENLRNHIYANRTIETLIQFEYSAFEEAIVPICTFAIRNRKINKNGCYFRLTDFRGGMEVQRQKTLEAIENHNCGFYYEANSENFSKIPGSPVAYWLSKDFIRVFDNSPLSTYASAKKGFTSSKDVLFLRLWHEIDYNNTTINPFCQKKRWFPLNKGGEFRRWFGNEEYLVDWENNGQRMKAFPSAVIRNEVFYCRESVSWNDITSGKISLRYKIEGQLFSDAGPSIFATKKTLLWILAFGNTKVMQEIGYLIAPTIHFTVGQMSNAPIIISNDTDILESVYKIVENNIKISKEDWDSFETSWDFEKHPLISYRVGAGYADVPMEKWQYKIKSAFECWQELSEERFNKLKANEEELNRIFIDIYGLQDELTPEVEDKDVTVRKADLTRDIKSFISYAVGCMFGRYSLDTDGLAYAGGEWDNSKYKTFIPDADNCIPITDTDYFSDDIVNRFVEFVKAVYGADTLEENLKFIADALGNKGITSRDVIREYFMKDFMKDHIKMYQKRPIYWLFDSGKQNGFKALVYMHRWNQDTIGNVRVEYLHKLQRIYDRVIEDLQDTIDNSNNSKDIAKAEKQKDKITKQLKETRDYDEKIAHLALMQIDIDLDDGVKVNYEKVQTADGKNLEILAKI